MQNTLKRLILALYLFVLTIPVLWGTLGNLSHKSYLAAFVAAALLLFILWFGGQRFGILKERLNRTKPAAACLCMSLFFVLFNGVFAFFFRPVQAADYRTFFQVAKDLSNGIHPGMKDYVAMFPHILGYSAFLSLFLHIFGQNLAVAVALNVLMTLATGILMFYLMLNTCDVFSSVCVFFLWTICPSKMFYNTMSLSEPYYTFLLILLFYLVSCSAKQIRKDKPGYLRIAVAAAFCGVILTLIQSARPIAVIPIIALVLWILFFSDREQLPYIWKRWSFFTVLLIFCYFVGGKAWQAYATEQLEQMPPSVPGYNIYVGFNPETNGSYSDEDMTMFQDLYFGECDRNAAAAQHIMLQATKDRVFAIGTGLPHLMLYKLKTLLSHDEGGAYYAMESLTERQYSISCLISNIWYYFTCILSLLGAAKLWKKRECGMTMMMVLFVIGLVMAQLLVEVAARYHYAIIPVLLMVAAFAIYVPVLRTEEEIRA